MNGKDIFIGLGYIDQKYVEEAEHGEFPQPKLRSLRRPLLIAALVALMLMLVGCAAVYVMHLQDLKVSEFIRNEDSFNSDGSEYLGTVEVPYQVLSMNGIQDTPAYLASQEWFDFIQSYDPNYEIWDSVKGNRPEFPAKYDAYDIYTQEMADKVDEISEKYDLKIPGKVLTSKNEKAVPDFLGVNSFLLSDAKARIGYDHAWAYRGGNFSAVFALIMEKGDGRWPHPMWVNIHYLQKDYFDPWYIDLYYPEIWEEHNYTTESGYNVLILYSETAGNVWIVCDRGDTVITVDLPAFHKTLNTLEKTVFDRISLSQLEQIADSLDFGIQPSVDESLARKETE